MLARLKLKNKYVIQAIFMTFVICVFYQIFKPNYIYKTDFMSASTVKLKVFSLVVANTYQTYWYSDICPQNNMSQPQRLDYYLAVLNNFSEDLWKSGEGGTIFYECILDQDKALLVDRLVDFEKTNLFNNMSDNGKNYTLFIKEVLSFQVDNK